MPKLIHRPPKYRYHKSTGQAVVSINGKAIQLGPFGSERSHLKYQELLGEWRANRRQEQPETVPEGEAAEPVVTLANLQQRRRCGYSVTLAELALVYQGFANGYYQKRGKPTREAQQVTEVLQLVLRDKCDCQLDEFGPVALKSFREEFLKERDWSRKHTNEQVNRIRRMFRWAAENELVPAALYQALMTVAGLKKGRSAARESEAVKPVADDVVEATLPYLPEIVADMVRLQRLTGARPGEICEVRPVDIDRSGDIWVYSPDGHKMDHFETDRLVMIGPRGQDVLGPYLDRAEAAYCFSPAETVARARERQRKDGRTARARRQRTGKSRTAVSDL